MHEINPPSILDAHGIATQHLLDGGDAIFMRLVPGAIHHLEHVRQNRGAPAQFFGHGDGGTPRCLRRLVLRLGRPSPGKTCWDAEVGGKRIRLGRDSHLCLGAESLNNLLATKDYILCESANVRTSQ